MKRRSSFIPRTSVISGGLSRIVELNRNSSSRSIGTAAVKVLRAMTPDPSTWPIKSPLGLGGGREDTGVAGSHFTSWQESVNQDTILVIRGNGMVTILGSNDRQTLRLLFLTRGNRFRNNKQKRAHRSFLVAAVMDRRA